MNTARSEEVEILELVLTAQCNLRCVYCYQNSKRPRRMSWDTLRGALDFLLGSRRKRLEVLFLGGEPLLDFPLIRKAVAYIRAERPRSKQVDFSLITNGSLLGEEQARFLDRHRMSVQLSFDGVRAAQDLRGRGTFEVLDRLLDRLRLQRPRLFHNRLNVSTLLTAASIPHLADSIGYFIGKGVPELSIAPRMTHDPDWKNEMIEALDEQLAKASRTCLRHYRRTGEVPLLLFRKDNTEGRRGSHQDAMCGAPTGRTLAIDVDGQVHGCVVFTESYQTFPSPLLRGCVATIRLGDFRAPDFSERLAWYPEAARRAKIFHDKRGKHSSFGRCSECRFLESCSVCPASIGHIPENTDPTRIPDFPCAFNRVALTWRERFPLGISPPTGRGGPRLSWPGIFDPQDGQPIDAGVATRRVFNKLTTPNNSTISPEADEE